MDEVSEGLFFGVGLGQLLLRLACAAPQLVLPVEDVVLVQGNSSQRQLQRDEVRQLLLGLEMLGVDTQFATFVLSN